MTSSDSQVFLSSSPHFTAGSSTQRIMGTVLISLIPECVCAVVVFGLHALVTLFCSVAGCVCFEALFQKVTKKPIRVFDLSAAVTGVLLALSVTSMVSPWMVLVGAFVAVVVGKGLFGGLGQNTFNPALTGRGFMVLSFGSAMNTYFSPNSGVSPWKWNFSSSGVDALSSATFLGSAKNGNLISQNEILSYLIGNRAGCMGETSVILILISFLFLLLTKTIDFRAPCAMVLTVVCASFLYALAKFNSSQEIALYVLQSVLTGGLLYGATFMVTDYATSPVVPYGRVIFGAGCGLITFLIRTFGSYPEGVMFSILIMNAIVPFLNNVTGRKYGYGKRAGRAKDEL